MIEKIKIWTTKWGTLIGAIGLLSTSFNYIAKPIDKYKDWKYKQDSIEIAEDIKRIHYEVDVYVIHFKETIEILDSINNSLKTELDSLKNKEKNSKAIGLRSYKNGRFEYRDEFGNTHEAYKETIQSSDGSWRVRFKYFNRETGITHYLFHRYYYTD